jgi:DNA-binding MarR family transcriptional regulator
VTSIPTDKKLGYLVKNAQHEFRIRMDEALRMLRVTTPQYAVLSNLEEHPGLSNAQLARKCFVTPQTMNRIVFSLEKNGLVERRSHEHHGRIQETALSKLGAEKLHAAHEMVTEVENAVFASIPEDEKQILAALLEKIVQR